jgi:hypothetical protein
MSGSGSSNQLLGTGYYLSWKGVWGINRREEEGEGWRRKKVDL